MSRLSRMDVPGVTRETNDLLHAMQEEIIAHAAKFSVDGKPIRVEMFCLAFMELSRRLMGGHRDVTDLDFVQIVAQEANRIAGLCRMRAEYHATLAQQKTDGIAPS